MNHTYIVPGALYAVSRPNPSLGAPGTSPLCPPWVHAHARLSLTSLRGSGASTPPSLCYQIYLPEALCRWLNSPARNPSQAPLAFPTEPRDALPDIPGSPPSSHCTPPSARARGLPLTLVLGTPLEGTAPNPPSFQSYSSFIDLLKSPFLHEVLPLVPTANGLPLPDPGTVLSVFLFVPEPFVFVFHLQLDGRFPGEQDWARLTRFCVLHLAGSDVRASCVYDVTRSCWVNGDTGV